MKLRNNNKLKKIKKQPKVIYMDFETMGINGESRMVLWDDDGNIVDTSKCPFKEFIEKQKMNTMEGVMIKPKLYSTTNKIIKMKTKR